MSETDPIAIMQAAQLTDADEQADIMKLALGSALAALRVSKPSNESTAIQIAGAKKQIVEALKGAA